MRKISEEELKKMQLSMLKSIHSFCEKNNINYFLAYGTLIGAIRHKGYIPWDDDIDIMMPREDYNKFLATFNGSIDGLRVYAPELNIEYYAPYANVIDCRTYLVENSSHRGINLGVKIDVFPLDKVPQELSDYNSFSEVLEKYFYILKYKRDKVFVRRNIKYTVRLILKKLQYCFVKYTSIQRRIMHMMEAEKKKNSNFVDNAVFPVYQRKRFDKSLIESIVKVEFEGYLFNAPVGYDEILKTIYGDYMQLPPIEKRIPHHGFTAYWID